MLPFDFDEVTMFMDHSLSIPTRTIYLGSSDSCQKQSDQESEIGIDYKRSEQVIKAIHVLDNLGTGPITLVLNNIGGDVYHGLAIYDAIKLSKNEVNGLVLGQAMSMGSVILQACKKRCMSPSSILMVHMGNLSTLIDQRDIFSHTGEWSRCNDVINEMYLSRIREKNPRYSLNQLKELLSTDRYLTAQQSIDLGLADTIGG